MKKEVFIGLTYGDPAGIGPEILLQTLKSWKFKLKPLIIGFKEILFYGNKKLKKEEFNIDTYSLLSNKRSIFLSDICRVPSKFSGLHSYLCLKDAINLAKDKKIKALVTGPVSKQYINEAGIGFIGQTEELARGCEINSNKVIMLFIAEDLRIALFTRHISLKKVSSKVKEKEFINFVLLLNNELKRWFHIKSPRIAVLGLNPHAGENGVIGNEEKKIIIPAIKILKSKGINLSGPFSADAALAIAGQSYLNNKKQNYDVYISFYHDQALPMFKAIAGMDGVNVTLGLPFLRVSVDHGTAFDIAHKNKASNKSMLSAIKFLELVL